MKMGVDETGRDETAFGFDLFIHRLGKLFADILDLIAVEHDNAVFNNLVLPAVKADDITALYESSHCLAFQVLNSNRGRTNKRNHSRQVYFLRSLQSGTQSSLRKPLLSRLLTKVLS